jgi:aspartate racemase
LRIIGLLGGMSWESTVPYYRTINEVIKERLGGLHSAKLVLYSLDFHELEGHMDAGDWPAAGELLCGAARSLERAGAEVVVICSNTMHKLAPVIQAAVSIPLLHIADATANEILRSGLGTVGLLGTRVTMEQAFYRDRLSARHGLRVLTPNQAERDELQRVIFQELCLGHVVPASRTALRQIMAHLVAQGAEAIILGCTELAMLVRPEDTPIPLFDTTTLHARRAADWALARESDSNQLCQ